MEFCFSSYGHHLCLFKSCLPWYAHISGKSYEVILYIYIFDQQDWFLSSRCVFRELADQFKTLWEVYGFAKTTIANNF